MNPLDQLYARWNGKFPDLSMAVMGGVFTPSHNLQIIYVVIGFIAILMVYYLSRFELSPQMLLHYKSMLFLIALGGIYSNVALLVNSTTSPARVLSHIIFDIGLVTLSRAVGSVMFLMALVVSKTLAALSTIKPTLSRLVVALSATKQGLTAWRVIESLTTKAAHILHSIEYSTKSKEAQLCIH